MSETAASEQFVKLQLNVAKIHIVRMHAFTSKSSHTKSHHGAINQTVYSK